MTRPLNSQSMKEDDFMTYKLKRLLQEQTIKNESLNEKNNRLNAQLKSLIVLLQKKDDEISASFYRNSTRYLFRAQGAYLIVGWVWGKRKSLVADCFAWLRTRALKGFDGFGRLLEDVLIRILNGWKRKVFDLVRGGPGRDFKIGKFALCLEKVALKFGFDLIVNEVRLRKGVYRKNVGLCLAIHDILEKRSGCSSLLKLFFASWKNKAIREFYFPLPIRSITRSMKKIVFHKIQLYSIRLTQHMALKELSNSETKCKVFSHRFKNLNSLVLTLRSFNRKQKLRAFSSMKPKTHPSHYLSFLKLMKKLIKPYFKSFQSKKTARPILSFLIKKRQKLTQEIFQALTIYSFSMTEEILSFEFSTISNQGSSLSSSIPSLTYKLEELKKNNQSTQSLISKQEDLYKEKTLIASQSQEKLNELKDFLSKQKQDLESFESENNLKISGFQENISKLKKTLEQNNTKIKKTEENFDSLCEKIQILENDGRTASVKLAQLEAANKKIQEVFTNVISERNRFLAQESEIKKQKIIFAGKIDSLAEEKEKMMEKLAQVQHDKKIIYEELEEKNDEIQELNEVLTEISAKIEIMTDKKTRILSRVDEDFDLKGNLLAHRQKELIKLKDHLSFNITQIESKQKELNLKFRPGDKESTLKLEISQLSSKNDEIIKEIHSESNKISGFISDFTALSIQNDKLKEELKLTQDSLNVTQETYSSLKSKLIELSGPSATSSVDESFCGMKDYASSLEAKIQELTEKIGNSPGISRLQAVKAAHETRISKLEARLKECQDFALKSRAEVAEAVAEIEHYAHILNVMEEKMNETEEKVLICLREKEIAAEELMEVKDDYFGIIAKG